MGGTLFDQLNRKNPRIAKSFQEAMKGKPANANLDKTGAEQIFKQAMLDKKIITQEAEALVLLIDSGVLSAEAWTHLQSLLQGKQGEDALILGTKKRLTSAADLAGFNRALDLPTVRNVTFWSPGTLAHYRPIHYYAVKQLVSQGKIKVFELEAANLNVVAQMGTGIYDEATNEFWLYSGAVKTPLVVHESTHAIQDWRDFSSTDLHLEADAYIAEAVVMVDLGITIGWTPPGRVAASLAVPIVTAGKAMPSNKEWTKKDGPYYKVVQSLRASPQARNMKESSGPNEKDAWHKVLEALSGKKTGVHRYEL